MILTPEGLAQPVAPEVQTAFLGAGAVPPPGAAQQASGPFVVPMKTGIFGSASFEPIFSAACPLPKQELDLVVGQLNAASAKAAPKSCKFGPPLLLLAGLLICLVSLVSLALTYNSEDIADLDRVVVTRIAFFCVGAALSLLGGFGMVFALARLMSRALTAIRRELSELNAQFYPRGIDFQLIEWRQFVSTAGLPNTGYGPQMAGDGPQVRQVWKHALLIRALQPEQPGLTPSEPQGFQGSSLW